MLCYGLEKLGQKVLSRWYFGVSEERLSLWKSGRRLPTGAVQFPNCSSWYQANLERRIPLSSEEQQCLGDSSGRGQREELRDRTEECSAGTVLVLHEQLCSQAQAGTLFLMPGEPGSPDGEDRPLEKNQGTSASGHICAVGPGHW